MTTTQQKILDLENQKTDLRWQLIALTTNATKVEQLLAQISCLDQQIGALIG